MTKNKELLHTQNQQLEEWQKKMSSDGEAIKAGRGLASSLRQPFDIEENLKNIAKNVLPKIEITKEKLNADDVKLMTVAMYNFGLDNGAIVVDACPEEYRGMASKFRDSLIATYTCETEVEKALVDVIVNAYVKTMYYSKKLYSVVSRGTTNGNLNYYMAVIGKEIDRSNRHFISSLETLKMIKQPPIKLSVKTNSAFISQNQQFNTKS